MDESSGVPTGRGTQKEDRWRVVFTSPIANRNDRKALRDIIEYLDSLRNRDLGLDGYTRSRTSPTAFFGRYKGTDERVVVFFVDYKMDGARSPTAMQELVDIIHLAYEVNDHAQEEVWVTAHPVERFF